MDKVYMCIDLKSFYASVECRERDLDPLTTNLVVADASRTAKTICLAISPSLKSYGLPGRARLFEVQQKVNEINRERRRMICNRDFAGSSFNINELMVDHNLKLDFIVASPRMSYYMKYSTKIYEIYLQFLSEEDIYVYSIDEVFCDITHYLKYYNMSAYNLVTKMIQEVYKKTGITATAGIGANLYLAKVAMDIVAKHVKPNSNGVRIASLDEMQYRKLLWHHRPLTDFWRIGKGYAKKLESNKIYTMGDIARTSISNEDLLYKLFGINAELLIDHAWGFEPVTIADIKKYKPKHNCLTSGQVLHSPYNYVQTKLIIKEMADTLSLDLVRKKLVTDQLVLTIGYDVKSINEDYYGELIIDQYGRRIPKPVTGRINLDNYTSSSRIIIDKMTKLYDKIVDKELYIRRIYVMANNVIKEDNIVNKMCYQQCDLFTDVIEQEKKIKEQKQEEKQEKKIQNVVLSIKDKYGKNAILKAMNLNEGGTTIERNKQIGGHKA